MQGARSAETGMYMEVHEDFEHRATPQTSPAVVLLVRLIYVGRVALGQRRLIGWKTILLPDSPHLKRILPLAAISRFQYS